MLERFRKAQEPAIARLNALHGRGELPAPRPSVRPPFAERLVRKGPGAVIAEYKRASPSRGAINLSASPEEIAAAYAEAGASALSVLTEETYFQGGMSYLERMTESGLPLLRKDFLVHPLQVVETAASPASALLLIARMLDISTFVEMLGQARQAGLETVLEVFDEEDLRKVRAVLVITGHQPVIIQVNSRNLQTLRVDDTLTRTLIRDKQEGEVWIAASGISSREQVEERARLGFDAVLVGSSLMECPDPGEALAALTGKGKQP